MKKRIKLNKTPVTFHIKPENNEKLDRLAISENSSRSSMIDRFIDKEKEPKDSV